MTVEEMSRRPLAGRTALVTGAGRGIGRAIATGLADAGARVVLVARSRDQLAVTASIIASDDTVTIVADLGLGDGVDTVVAAAPEIDILINNAATVAPLGASVEVSREEYAAAYRVNVLAVAALTLALVPGMTSRGWGRVVNVSSGIVAYPAGMIGGNAYVATKAALEAHTVNLAAELADTGVTVNAYRPGTVDTAMQDWIREQDPERIGAGLHQRFVDYKRDGALISPEASAASVLALLVGEETGQVWDVSQA